MNFDIQVVDSEMYTEQEIGAMEFWGITKRGYLKKVSRISKINCEIKQPRIFRELISIILVLKKGDGS